ncbi:MAG: hypothetical protein KY475_23940 [Planctomycetes bacterium]|nr:hypothetical protein [Planctomycetota bacterium]
MPYDVTSHCPACSQGDEFVIGLWPKHLGVHVCGGCRAVVNVPLETGACRCGARPAAAEFYDYAYSIPYFSGQSAELEPGRDCPKCRGAKLTFQTTTHFNVGRLGATEDGQRPWIGKDYLEKAIFAFALIAVCSELDLDPKEMLGYYNLDVPASLIASRRLSLPIFLDIRNHVTAAVMAGEATFTVSEKLHRTTNEECGELLRLLQPQSPRKAWWQFWK